MFTRSLRPCHAGGATMSQACSFPSRNCCLGCARPLAASTGGLSHPGMSDHRLFTPLIVRGSRDLLNSRNCGLGLSLSPRGPAPPCRGMAGSSMLACTLCSVHCLLLLACRSLYTHSRLALALDVHGILPFCLIPVRDVRHSLFLAVSRQAAFLLMLVCSWLKGCFVAGMGQDGTETL